MNRIIILFLCLNGFCFGQNFQAGTITGINTSQVSGDNLAGFNKLGFRLGGFVNKKIGPFTGQIEFQYINKGSKEVVDTDFYQQGYTFFLNYLEMPISVKTKLYNKTLLEIGCSVGYLLSSGEEINGYNETGVEVNNLDYSIHFGIDYKLSKKLYLNTRLSNSIAPIRKHASGQTYRWNRGQYNTGLSFILYYYIGVAKN
tara:strand:- start:31 stop:630 length:600 start_codon:yes stop_codon:yes gene_type:complete